MCGPLCVNTATVRIPSLLLNQPTSFFSLRVTPGTSLPPASSLCQSYTNGDVWCVAVEPANICHVQTSCRVCLWFLPFRGRSWLRSHLTPGPPGLFGLLRTGPLNFCVTTAFLSPGSHRRGLLGHLEESCKWLTRVTTPSTSCSKNRARMLPASCIRGSERQGRHLRVASFAFPKRIRVGTSFLV